MNKLYPLKFEPIIKEPIWGGSKLRTVLNKEKASDQAGESWEISGVEGNISVVENGFLAGNNLQELIEVYMGDLVGQKIFSQFGTDFPILIKFIDACNDLSIQVHPNDNIAAQRHHSFGKTEMWYVMQADEGSKLISGFSKEVSKKEYIKHLNNNTLPDILNTVEVKPGDVFFMPAGRIHAIGKGILLAEIQQTSNITYRVYDYNRKDAQGNSRDLHTEEAVDVIDYKFRDDIKTPYIPKKNEAVNLADCRYFTTNLLEIKGTLERDMRIFDSFIIYMGIEGNATISYDDTEAININKGETILIPASIEFYTINSDHESKLLEIYMAAKFENNED
ncbi:MAG: class I mannose-6-phosphate isomerase [Bacteroidales bacterium]|nr:class I mannose-6-phosphate isomerase [Bacteroidales bacterium]MBN2819394.1 class I mannose-6-phosphate isomerase [Bacteroidales bacterium]